MNRMITIFTRIMSKLRGKALVRWQVPFTESDRFWV